MTHVVISRADAFANGQRRYFTGVECKRGHLAQRFVSTGACVECQARHSIDSYKAKNTAQGKFVYPLRDARDHAAAWAYCQALDAARGYVPAMPPTTPPAATPEEISAHIAATRRERFGPEPQPERGLDPAMAEQLRKHGMLK